MLQENNLFQKTSITSLDDMVLSNLFSFFAPKDAALAGRTCKKLNKIERKIFERDYNTLISCKDQNEKEKIKFENAVFSSLKFLPNDNLAIMSAHGGFYLLDKNLNLINKNYDCGPLRCMDISGNVVITGSVFCGRISVWNGQTGEAEAHYRLGKNDRNNLIESIISLTDSLFICTHRENQLEGSIHLFNLQEKTSKILLEDEIEGLSQLERLSPNSFIGIDKQKNLSSYTLQPDLSLKKSILFHFFDKLYRPKLIKLSTELLILFDDKKVKVWSLNKKKFLYDFFTNRQNKSDRACTSNVVRLSNIHFASVDDDAIKIWDLKKGKCINLISSDKSISCGIAKMWNGNLLVCGCDGYDGILRKLSFSPLGDVEEHKSSWQLCRIS